MRNLNYSGWVVAALLALVATGCSKDSQPAASSSGRDKTPKGLGVVCTKDADCRSGLTCHLDATDPTDYQLCTATCATDTDCQKQFAAYTTCTGARVCAVMCDVSDDCVAGTTCDDHGWCQRGGPDSGVQACVGTVAACSTVTTEAACDAAHCTWGGNCTGTPSACSTAKTASACTTMHDCTWYAAASKCDGTPTVCDYYLTANNCVTHGGDCPVPAANCTSLATASDCAAVPGCTWSADAGTQCSGTPVATKGCGGCSWANSCTGTSSIATCEVAGLTFCATTPGCQLVTQ